MAIGSKQKNSQPNAAVSGYKESSFSLFSSLPLQVLMNGSREDWHTVNALKHHFFYRIQSLSTLVTATQNKNNKSVSMLITLSTLCICAATRHMAKSLCGKVKIFHCSAANLWAEFRIWLRKLWWWCFWREGAGWSLSPPSDLSPPKPSQVHGVLLYSSLGHCCTSH